MRTRQDIEKLVNYYKTKLEEHGRVFDKPILTEVFKRKTYKTYGTARVYSNRLYHVVKINQWIKHDHDLVNTILHELSHLDSEAIGDGHGRKWKRVAAIYGKLFNTNIVRTSRKELTISKPKKTYIWGSFIYTDKAPTRLLNPDGVVHRFANKQAVDKYVNQLKPQGLLKDFTFITEEEARDRLQK